MISSRAKHILSFTGGLRNLVRGNIDDTAYLVRKGQQEVVEQEGGGCNLKILDVTFHSGSKNRRKLTLTPNEVLGI
jgi:hypothetical protein